MSAGAAARRPQRAAMLERSPAYQGRLWGMSMGAAVHPMFRIIEHNVRSSVRNAATIDQEGIL